MIPVQQRTFVNARYEPSFLAGGMTADNLHAILREAECGDTRNLFCLYRDVLVSCSHLQAEFAKRKAVVLGDPMSFLPHDKRNRAAIQAAAFVSESVGSCATWMPAMAHLLDSGLWPVSVVEKTYRPAYQPGRFVLDSLMPVPHHLQCYQSGSLEIFDTDGLGQILSTRHSATPDRYIVHRGSLLATPDNWGGPFRSVLFWWLLGAYGREWWARFLDRFGSPFPVGKYDAQDHESKAALEKAFALSTRIGGLVVSRETQIELVAAGSSQTGEAHARFIELCNRELSKLVVGQTLSSEAQPTGLGSGVAAAHEAVRDDIRRMDARLLSETLRQQLFGQMLSLGGHQAMAPRVTFGSESEASARQLFAALSSASQAGLEVDDAGLAQVSERLGLPMRRRVALPFLPPA